MLLSIVLVHHYSLTIIITILYIHKLSILIKSDNIFFKLDVWTRKQQVVEVLI